MQIGKPKAEIDTKIQNRVVHEGKIVKIDACDVYFKDLNCLLRQIIAADGI